MQKHWIALVPAYEPGPELLRLLREAADTGRFETIVVNDGSGADCAEIFRQAAAFATVLTHPENRGKGRALKTGLAYIAEHCPSESVIVTLDADGQHRVEDAERLCRAAEEHAGTLVLGSRAFRGRVPLRSRLGNAATRLVYALSTGLRVRDTQTGLRAFDRSLLSWLESVSGERYEYEMNVLLEGARRGVPIREVETATVYLDNNASSHFDTLRDSYRVYREILRFSAASFVSFLLDYGVYSLLLLVTAGLDSSLSLRLSNVLARVVSAGVNFALNRRLVFRSRSGLARSALKYFALAALVLLGNTLVLRLLVEGWGMNRMVAKICTEALFFLLSWLIQRCFVFRGREAQGVKEAEENA